MFSAGCGFSQSSVKGKGRREIFPLRSRFTDLLSDKVNVNNFSIFLTDKNININILTLFSNKMKIINYKLKNFCVFVNLSLFCNKDGDG